MNPFRISLLGAGIVVLIAAGCGSAPSGVTPTSAPVTAPSPEGASRQVSASIEVEPVRTSDLSFLISGRVKEVLVKAGDEVKAGDPLIVLEAPDLEYAAVSAQAEADSAEINQLLQRSTRDYRVWTGRKWIWTGGLPELRLAADARLQKALGSLDVAKAELAQARLVAPFDGTVVSIDVAPGEMVEPDESVLVFADLRHLQVVTTDLSERDVARIGIGQPASVQLKAFDEPLPGTIRSIDVMASKSEDGDTVFEVTIDLDQQPDGLLWGMSGEVFIESASQ
jgi:RND family efflux transporter MFP subunit